MSYSFDGANDSIHWGDIPAIDDATEITISVWVKNDALTSDGALFATWDGSNGFLLWRDDMAFVSGRTDTYSFLIDIGPGDARVEGATGAATTSGWQNIIASFSNTAASNQHLQLWIDGVEDANSPVDKGSVTHMGQTGNNVICGTDNPGDFDLDGDLGEIAVWTRVLSDEEKQFIAAHGDPNKISTNLVFHAPLEADANDDIGPVSGTVSGATLDSTENPGRWSETAQARMSYLDWCSIWEPGLPPAPPLAFDQGDQQHMLWGYQGIEWQAPAADAIDATDNVKLANMEWCSIFEPALPRYSGTPDQGDKQQLLWGYPDVLWGETEAVESIYRPIYRPRRR